MVGTRLPPYPDTPTMTEQGAVGDFYDLRAFTTFAVPSGTPKDIVDRLTPLLIQAGTDPKVQQMLNNLYCHRRPISKPQIGSSSATAK